MFIGKQEENYNFESYGIWFDGRRTPITVQADSRSEAIAKARKKKKRGGEKVKTARVLKPNERKTANSGAWLRSGPNGESAGYNKSFKGQGPTPKKG